MKRYWYALHYHDESAFNDSREKMRDWSTASVVVYDNKAKRDEDITNSHFIAPLSANEAYFFIGKPGSDSYNYYLREHNPKDN